MPSHYTYNERDIILRISQGDEAAFTEFFHQYQQRLFTVSKMYLKVDALAEEALQEVFIKVWVNRSKISEIKDLESWLFIVAKNYLIDFIEKWARQKATEQSWGNQQTQNQYDDDNIQQMLNAAITTLSPQQKEVFRLSKEEQLTYKQIGERLSLSPLTVKTHMQRALQQIRQYLESNRPLLILIITRIITLL